MHIKKQSFEKEKTICFLAPANNYHTQKWCKWFYEHGYLVHVISFTNGYVENVTTHVINNNINTVSNDFLKLKYLTLAKKVKNTVLEIKPDIISVHFASSYGTVAALAGIKKYTLSVWGSDIFTFPKKSIFHKLLICYSLKKASQILATSSVLAKETSKYTNKNIKVTPFGVDTLLFHPNPGCKTKERVIIGTIKALSPHYGIDYLIKATAIIVKEYPQIPIELHIAGCGEKETEYKNLAKHLNINQKIKWLGFISQKEVAEEWTKMDIAVIYSANESFGVSAIEAQACGVPLIISDAPGLLESTKPGESSVVVPYGDEHKLAKAIVNLYNDEKKRASMSIVGRKYVLDSFEIKKCFRRIEKCLSEEI